jgi:hypothetical protein
VYIQLFLSNKQDYTKFILTKIITKQKEEMLQKPTITISLKTKILEIDDPVIFFKNDKMRIKKKFSFVFLFF